VFERRRHFVDRYSDDDDEVGEDRFAWTYDNHDDEEREKGSSL
jgi:hypothetical protein